MKVNLIRDEWYPSYSIDTIDEESMCCIDKLIDIDPVTYIEYQQAIAAWNNIQEKLHMIYNNLDNESKD